MLVRAKFILDFEVSISISHIGQIMRVGADYKTIGGNRKARGKLACTSSVVQFIVVEGNILRESSEYGDNAVGFTVDMSRVAYTAIAFNGGTNVIYGYIACVDKQIVYLIELVIVSVKNGLIAENFRSVFDFISSAINVFVKGQSILQMLEKANNVNILGCGKLHSGNGNYSVPFCRLEKGGTVFAAVVIGERKNIKPAQLRHTDDIARRVILVTAGRETGVDV